jgi:8-oxo-dGTP pyrophosphatase MutT (NUDIX family)
LRVPIFDPQSIPFDGIAGEAALDSSRLNLAWIKQHFAHPPPWQPEVNGDPRIFPEHENFTNAAVLITMVERESGLHLLFTSRTKHLAQHPGQISFPGGRMDAEDSNAIDTALREAYEEIGLHKELVDVFGTLPDYFTITGYRVTPVVAAVRQLSGLKLNSNEVAEIFEVPLAYLMDGKAHQRRSGLLPNQTVSRSFYAMPYQNYFIWGATAGMLRNLFHFLRAD